MIVQDKNLVDELIKDANLSLLESNEDTLDQEEEELYLVEVFEAITEVLLRTINRREQCK